MTKSQVPVPWGRKPKPPPSSTTTSQEFITTGRGAGSIPGSTLGMPVPAVLGRKRVPNPNTIWTGNLRPILKTTYETVIETETKEVNGYLETITVEKTTVTTTIEGYLCDIHMGICLGPDVQLHAVYVDNQRIWSGLIGPLRTSVNIGENKTFLTGVTMVFSGGAFDQVPEPDINQADYPGYVGIAYALLKNVRVDLPMGNISFEVSRVPNPLGLADAVNKDGQDLNIASAMVEVMTNEWGYGSLTTSDIDVANFTAGATTLAGENNFCSVKLDNNSGIASVLSSMLRQAGGLIYQDPETGKLKLVLERPNQINYASSLALGRRNIIDFRNFDKTTWDDAVDTLRGLFTERDADYNEVPIYMPNVAKLSQNGRKRTTGSVYYPFVTNRELLADLLARDMAYVAGPVFSFQVTTNRDAATRTPGSVVTVTKPEYELYNTPCIVTKVRKQDRMNNTVVLNVRQAKLPDTASYGVGGDPYDPGFDLTPKTPLGVRIVTSPYLLARWGAGINGVSISPLNYPIVLPVPANNMQSDYDVYITNPPNAPDDVLVGEGKLYPTYAELTNAISKYDGFTTGIIASVDIENVVNSINLGNQGEAGVRQGRYVAFINDEIISFEAAVDNGGAAWTLSNVHRGLFDTVAQDHAAGSMIHIIGGSGNQVLNVPFPYPIGWTPMFLFVPHTLIEFGTKGIGLSSDVWPQNGMRKLSPPRPHNTKIDAQPRSSTELPLLLGTSCTVTWATRTRLSDGVTLQLDPAEEGEVKGLPATSQIHRVLIRDSANVLHDCGTAAYGLDTLTFTLPEAAAEGVGYLYVQAEITMGTDTYESLYQDRIPVLLIGDSIIITEDSGSFLLSEDGASFIAGETF